MTKQSEKFETFEVSLPKGHSLKCSKSTKRVAATIMNSHERGLFIRMMMKAEFENEQFKRKRVKEKEDTKAV